MSEGSFELLLSPYCVSELERAKRPSSGEASVIASTIRQRYNTIVYALNLLCVRINRIDRLTILNSRQGIPRTLIG
jgi:hypothetical protein